MLKMKAFITVRKNLLCTRKPWKPTCSHFVFCLFAGINFFCVCAWFLGFGIQRQAEDRPRAFFTFNEISAKPQ